MAKLQKPWRKPLFVAAVSLIALQAAVSLLVRTQRAHVFLAVRLERAFGRPVEVGSFDVRILPSPQLDAVNVSVGEDPAFGYEYFLRAERMSAGLRWTGLLRGRFEFGTLALSRPSLILVRNAEGRWNLERWLPPPKTNPATSARVYGPPSPAAPVNRLERIEFDEGRINFKSVNDKQPFAFTNVSGSVDQVSPGRWQLQLKAKPWRSGVSLQAAGIINVRGDVAGTSARLQPAEVSLQWSEASLADVFRLFRGQDYGARGMFALDADAKSASAQGDAPGDWTFSVQARAGQIHRWDLAERADNPRLHASVKGRWNVGARTMFAEQIVLEAPASNLCGMFRLTGGEAPSMELRLDSLGVKASDLLAWYRAFHSNVAEGVTAEQYFTGGMILRAWPLTLESAALSSTGGIARVPGFASSIRIGPLRGGHERGTLRLGPMRVALGGAAREGPVSKGRRPASAIENAADLTFTQDLSSGSGSISVEGNIDEVGDFLKLSAALGQPLNRGWELAGQATAAAKWEWNKPFRGRWNGRISLNDASLTVAGLNQPLAVLDGALEWADGLRSARDMRVEGFGGTWTGVIEERPLAEAEPTPKWSFRLFADQMDAADLDRWVGPRARPGWLQRLLSSLLGATESAPSLPASELVRRIDAEGELSLGKLTIEKLKLSQVHAQGSLHDLQLDVHEAEAEWAGGKVRARIHASFLPRPTYEISADLERVNLAELPGTGRMAARLNGVASGNLQLQTAGVGRDELLAKLAGQGKFQLSKVEFRGWDVNASVADGVARSGVSRWPRGECAFLVRNRNLVVQRLDLNAGREQTSVEGKLSFASDADLSVSTHAVEKSRAKSKEHSEKGHVLKISGPLDGPRVTVERLTEPQLVD